MMTDNWKCQTHPARDPREDNPCDGIWIRKSTHVVKEWGGETYHEGERYWSGFWDYDPDLDAVTLRPYRETIKDPAGWDPIVLRPQFIRERFDWLGHGVS